MRGKVREGERGEGGERKRGRDKMERGEGALHDRALAAACTFVVLESGHLARGSDDNSRLGALERLSAFLGGLYGLGSGYRRGTVLREWRWRRLPRWVR